MFDEHEGVSLLRPAEATRDFSVSRLNYHAQKAIKQEFPGKADAILITPPF